MDVVILGAGKIGSYVAKTLSKEECNVTLIDQNRVILEQIGRDLDIATLHAKAPSWSAFEELMGNSPDVFFAATGDDETNLVSCSIAKNLGFPKTICRIKREKYLNHPHLDFGHLFHIDHFVGAETLAAQDLFNILIHSEDIAADHFAHGAIQMRTVKIPDTWDKAQIPIQELKLPENLIIGLIHRKVKEKENRILIPHGDAHLLPGDEVSLVGEADIMEKAHELFHIAPKKIRTAILFGGTLIAEHLAHLLLKQKIGVRIIDFNYERCQELAESLPEATIINRDGRDPALLKGERVKDADVAVAATYHDGTNLLIAAIAKQNGCPKALALVANSTFTPILDKVGVLPALSAQVGLANRILSILHESTIVAIGSLSNDQAKIVELKVAPSCKYIGIPLSDLPLPKNLLIAVIQNKGKVAVGKGGRILSGGDTVIVICTPEEIPHLPEIFH